MQVNTSLTIPATETNRIEEIIEKYSVDEVLQFVQQNFQQHTHRVTSGEIEDIGFKASQFSSSPSGTASQVPFLEQLYQTDTLTNVWFKIQNASQETSDITLSELGNSASGFSDLGDYFLSSAYKYAFKDITLCSSTMQSVSHVIKKHFPGVNQEQCTTEIRPYEVLIGTAEAPGTVIVQLRNFVQSTQLSDTQKIAISSIQNCFLNQLKLKLFSSNPDERKKQYEKLAQLLSLVLTHHNQAELANDFAEGEGSLCELPGVCYTGWSARINQLIPKHLKSPEGLSGVIHKQLELKRDTVFTKVIPKAINIVFENLANDHYTNPHTNIALKHILNKIYELELRAGEIGPIEPANLQFISQALIRNEARSSEFLLPPTLKSDIEKIIWDYFETLNHEKKDLFLEEVVGYYRSICVKSPCYYLHQHIDLQEQFDKIHQYNQMTDPQERIEALKKVHSSILDTYGVNPFPLLPHEIQSIFSELQGNYRHKLHGLKLNQESNAATALLEHCTQNSIPLSIADHETLTHLCDEANYLEAQRSRIEQAISAENMERRIIDLNCQIFKTLLFDRDAVNIHKISLSTVGLSLIVCIANPKSANIRLESDGLGLHIFTGMHEAFWKSKGENSQRITDGNSLLQNLKKCPPLLYFASDELLNNAQFILSAHKMHSLAISCIGSQLSKANDYKILKTYISHTNKEEPLYRASALRMLVSLHRNSPMIAHSASSGEILLNKTVRDLPILAPLFATKKKVLELLDYWNPIFIERLIRDIIPSSLKDNEEILCKAYTKSPDQKKTEMAFLLRKAMSKEAFLQFIFRAETNISAGIAYQILLTDPPKEYIDTLMGHLSSSALLWLLQTGRSNRVSFNEEFIEQALQKLSFQDLKSAIETLSYLKTHPFFTKDFLEKLAGHQICEMLHLLPHLRSDAELVQRLFETHPESIPDLFKVLTHAQRKCPEFVYSTLAQCPDHVVYQFYNAPLPKIRDTREFLHAIIERSQPQFIVFLVDELSLTYRQDIHLMITLIRKTIAIDIPSIVMKAHKDLRQNTGFLLEALRCCPPEYVLPFCEKLKRSIQNIPVIAEEAINRSPRDDQYAILSNFSKEIRNNQKKRDLLSSVTEIESSKKPRPCDGA